MHNNKTTVTKICIIQGANWIFFHIFRFLYLKCIWFLIFWEKWKRMYSVELCPLWEVFWRVFYAEFMLTKQLPLKTQYTIRNSGEISGNLNFLRTVEQLFVIFKISILTKLQIVSVHMPIPRIFMVYCFSKVLTL